MESSKSEKPPPYLQARAANLVDTAGCMELSSGFLVAPGRSLRYFPGRKIMDGAVAPILTLPFPDKMPIQQLRLDSSTAILGHTCSEGCGRQQPAPGIAPDRFG